MICSFWSSMLILASAGSLCCTIRDVFGLSIRHEAGGQHLRWILLSVFLRLLRKSLLFLYVVFMQIPLSFYPQMLFPNPQPPQFLNPRHSFQNPSLLNFLTPDTPSKILASSISSHASCISLQPCPTSPCSQSTSPPPGRYIL